MRPAQVQQVVFPTFHHLLIRKVPGSTLDRFGALTKPNETVAVHAAILPQHFLFKLVGLELCPDLVRNLVLESVSLLAVAEDGGVVFEILVELWAGEEGGSSPFFVLEPSVGESWGRELDFEGAGIEEACFQNILLSVINS